MTRSRHHGPDDGTPPRHARGPGDPASSAPEPVPAPDDDTTGDLPAATDPDDPVLQDPAGMDEAGGPEQDGAYGVKRTSLGRSSLVMTLGTLASRLSGLVRTVLLVACVGATGTVADSFDIGNKLPSVLFALLSAGVIQAVLIPQIVRAMQAPDARVRLDKLLSVSGLGMLLLTAVLVVAAPFIVGLYTLSDAWTPEARNLATLFAYWCIPQIFFYGLYMLLGQVLNARGQFGVYGVAPVANNIVSFLGFGAFILVWGTAPDQGISDLASWTTPQTLLLAGTATLGIASQAMVLVIALARTGFRWRFRWGLRGIGLRSAGTVVGWTIGAVVLEQLGVLYLSNMLGAAARSAEAAGEVVGGNMAYTQAMTIYLLPHALVVVSIVTVLFPRMTAAVQSGELDVVRADMSLGMRSAGVFSVFSATALIVLAEPLVAALLPPFSEVKVDAIAPVLQAMAIGTVALGATVMVKRMYFAFEDGRSIFLIQGIATVVLVAALWAAVQLLPFEWWAAAAGGAFALSTWVSVLMRVQGMRRKLHGVDGRRILRLYVRAAVAAVVAGGLGWWVVLLMGGHDLSSWGQALGVTAVAGLTMAVAYVAMLKLLRVRELDAAIAPVLRRLGR